MKNLYDFVGPCFKYVPIPKVELRSFTAEEFTKYQDEYKLHNLCELRRFVLCLYSEGILSKRRAKKALKHLQKKCLKEGVAISMPEL